MVVGKTHTYFSSIKKSLRTYYCTSVQELTDESIGKSIRCSKRLYESGGFILAGTKGGGLFRSGDGGETWMMAATGIPNTDVNDLALIGGRMLTGYAGGILYSGMRFQIGENRRLGPCELVLRKAAQHAWTLIFKPQAKSEPLDSEP